ncbi:hypothetical protein AGMMS49983_21040 [Clostridia bacterium]|nr:hypothetical protein AGMMS49983_21040 [Clostridia bacterium]
MFYIEATNIISTLFYIMRQYAIWLDGGSVRVAIRYAEDDETGEDGELPVVSIPINENEPTQKGFVFAVNGGE